MNDWQEKYRSEVQRTAGVDCTIRHIARGRYDVYVQYWPIPSRYVLTRRKIEAFTENLLARPSKESA